MPFYGQAGLISFIAKLNLHICSGNGKNQIGSWTGGNFWDKSSWINPKLQKQPECFFSIPGDLNLSVIFFRRRIQRLFIHEKHPWVLRTKFMINPSEDS
jgi:hypothetical protein